VVLSGDGGDEAFGGYYRHFLAHRLWSRSARLPAPLRRFAAASIGMAAPETWERVGAAVNPILPASYRQHHFGSRIHKLSALLRSEEPQELYDALVSGAPSALAGPRTQVPPLHRRAPIAALSDTRLQFMLADQLSYLPDDVLTKVDRCSMQSSLEVRTPLLDHRLIEFAWTLPAHFKLRDGRGKWVLRQVLARHVPTELWDRPKSGFGAPIQQWLRGSMRSWAEELLRHSVCVREGWLDGACLTREWNSFQRGAVVDFNSLWSALMLEAWFRNNAP
jgi:asparagine synthase (glutamine-hydrolysing)